MSFWNKIKSLLGVGANDEPAGEKQRDEPADGGDGQRARTKPVVTASSSVAAKFSGASTPSPPARKPATTPTRPKTTATKQPAKAAPPNSPPTTGVLLGLSKDELRQRALKIDPYRTAWIGRVDTIPPQSDERTALIDRGLILRGLLSEEQIQEIHRVGDLWLRHHDALRLATSKAAKTVELAFEQMKRERAERKVQKQREAAERRRRRVEDVARRRAEDIIFLGSGVSSRLVDRRSHIEALTERGLPLLSTPADVARALGISVPRLRWLCYHGDAVERPHYVYFEVPKRSGGKRLLSAPHASLAQAQTWILRSILDKLPTENPAHGFVAGRSTVTNAREHLGRDIVVNLDLRDFFPTITFPRARGVFQRVGYSPAVATILALLCTECPRREVDYDGQRYWVAIGDRGLPQGACTSPALSNQVARKLDRRLAGMAAKHGWTYTRYADDLTFSAPPGKRSGIPMLLARVRHIVTEEGFTLHPSKGRIQRAARRQEVTGIVVNDKLSVPRDELRRLRAILHAAKTTGLEAQNREQRPDFEAHIRGKIAYVAMVDPEKAAPLRAALDALPR
ncbi:DNA polymerase [Chondromyces crocatus]|uniref:RNA-directed DNA polymerase n=1 Tax=Chondromyces crocatus TaxID=52 RepID=A0A0K1ESS8_CHOCO|nr:DNA polymerase [Chondromyces crocatus]